MHLFPQLSASLCTALALSLLLSASPAQAVVIYDNGAPDLVTSVASETGEAQIADDFTLLPGANTIGDIHWWGLYDDSPLPGVPADPDEFTIRIFEDAAGVPDALNFVEVSFLGAPGRAATGDHVAGYDAFEYWVDIDPLALDAGTTYWLSISNNSLGNGGDLWYWATAAVTGGNSGIRFRDGDDWQPLAAFGVPYEFAFNLTGAAPIPEPNAALIFGLGLVVVGRAMRRPSAGHASST